MSRSDTRSRRSVANWRLPSKEPGILAWAVRGCPLWQQDRLATPESIKRSTGEYREKMDVVGTFLHECWHA